MTSPPSPLAELLRIRYLLLWAQVRSNPGNVAFFVVAWLAALVLLLVLAAGGISAASMAASVGRLRQTADLALTAVFVSALVGSLALGAGVNDALSDLSMRRYPISSRQRAIARHLLALLEPTWLLVVVAEAGLAIGFCLAAASPVVVALVIVWFLLLTNYLAARILAAVANRILSTGPGVLASMLVSIAIPVVVAAGQLYGTGVTGRFSSLRTIIRALVDS